jgi:hypothetical protein
MNFLRSCFLSFFLSFLFRPLLPNHYRCRKLLLHLITLKATHTHTHTFDRTPLDGGSAICQEIYMATHNIHKRYTSMLLAGFEPVIPASEPPQTHVLDHADTWIFSNKLLATGKYVAKIVCNLNVSRLFFTKEARRIKWVQRRQGGWDYKLTNIFDPKTRRLRHTCEDIVELDLIQRTEYQRCVWIHISQDMIQGSYKHQ